VNRVRLVPLVFFVLAVAVARADDPKPPTDPALQEIREVLPNGLEVVVRPSARAKLCSVLVGYRTGARFEQTAEAGVSDLVSRLHHRAAVAALGSNTGSESLHELTYSWAVVPEDKLGVVLDFERDQLVASSATQTQLDEVRQELFNEPVKREARAWNSLIALAYPDSGLGRPRLGTAESVAALTLERVEAWRKAHFRVDTGVVVVAGARNPKAALDLVRARLGAVARPEAPLPEAPAVPPAAKGPVRSRLEGPPAARHIWIALRGPDAGSEDEAYFLAGAFALKDRVVVAMQSKAHDATVHVDARSDAPALLVVSATPRPATPVLDVEARLRGAADMVRNQAPADLEKLKGRVVRMLDACTAPLDPSLEGAKDEGSALADAALDRALASPLVLRRDALKKSVAAITADAFLAKMKVLLSEERMCLVTIEPAK
jgi:hypothetical protein